MIFLFLFLLIGIYFLYLGATYLINGTIDLGIKIKINHIFLGVFVLGFGTSLPELLVSIQSALNNNLYITYGNIIGSNIINVLFILSLSIIIGKVKAKDANIYDFIFLLLSNLTFIFLVLFFEMNYLSAICLLLIVSLYLIISYKVHKNLFQEQDNQSNTTNYFKIGYHIVVGFILLFLGADILIETSLIIAKKLNLSEKVIAVTIIALGTSLPEIATSIIAIFKKQTSMAIFNIIGSNLFNVTIVPSFSSLIANFKDHNKLFLIDSYFYLISLIILLTTIFYKKSYVPKFLGYISLFIYIVYTLILLK